MKPRRSSPPSSRPPARRKRTPRAVTPSETQRRAEEYFRLAIEGSNGGHWYIEFPRDGDPSVVPDEIYISPRIKQFIGFADHELPNSVSAWLARILPEDLPTVSRSSQDHVDGRSPVYEVEYRIRHKDGSIRWIHSRGRILRDAEGRPVRWAGVDWDITDRKQVETALRSSEESFRTLAENANDGILICDARGHHVYVNRRASEITGYSTEELLKTQVRDLAHPSVRKTLMDRLHKRFEGEPVPRQYETTISHKDGRGMPVEITAATTLWQGQPADIVIMRDITERRRAEEAYRCLAESSLQGMAIVQDNRIVYANPALAEILGLRLEELHGLTAEQAKEFIHPDTRSAQAQRYKDRVAGKPVPARYEWRAVRKDGRVVWVESCFQPTEFRGRPALQATLIDITRRRELEQEILEIGERERQRIGRDLHDDLGQQLAGIGFLAHGLQEVLQRARAPEAEMASRITALLKDAASTARKLAMGLVPTEDLAGGLPRAIEELATRTTNITHVPCRFNCALLRDIPGQTTAMHLYRIAQEAVTNALKHGAPRHVSIRLTQNESTVHLVVEDDGKGISEDSRLSPGLGIRLMHHRAGLLGGSLDVRRASSNGTVVTCTVPVPGPSNPAHPTA